MNDIIKYRREFHKYAESSWNEIRTSARVAEFWKDTELRKSLWEKMLST